MKKIYNFIFSLILILFSLNPATAQTILLPCSQCSNTAPDFVLFLNPSVDPPTNGTAGFGTTQAQLQVHFFNNTGTDMMLRTIELSLAINAAAISSLLSNGISTDAINTASFPNSNVFDIFNGNFVNVFDSGPNPLPNTLLGMAFTHAYEYDHTVTGMAFPPLVIPANSTQHVLTITFNFDGSQTFVDNDPAHPMYFGNPNFFLGYPGECVNPDVNINNQFGFIDNNGNQILSNCYKMITGPPTTNLPVELTAFSGEIFDRHNKLSWTTQSEINTAWHVVQRSADPAEFQFEDIGRVAAAGHSESTLQYSFDDNQPTPIAYYRLKTEDLDGSTQFSDIIILKRNEGFGILSLYPNPSYNKFEVEYSVDRKGETEISIIDILGRTAHSEIFDDKRGAVKRTFDISRFGDGVYILKISNGAEVRTKELIKVSP